MSKEAIARSQQNLSYNQTVKLNITLLFLYYTGMDILTHLKVQLSYGQFCSIELSNTNTSFRPTQKNSTHLLSSLTITNHLFLLEKKASVIFKSMVGVTRSIQWAAVKPVLQSKCQIKALYYTTSLHYYSGGMFC